MTVSVPRDDLVRRSRLIPKDWVGAASIVGFALAIAGLVALLVSGLAALGLPPNAIDWRIAATGLLVGTGLMSWAGFVMGRRFNRLAAAAGHTPEQVREIEDEAERLNEEED